MADIALFLISQVNNSHGQLAGGQFFYGDHHERSVFKIKSFNIPAIPYSFISALLIHGSPGINHILCSSL